jgi:hypothetical protein
MCSSEPGSDVTVALVGRVFCREQMDVTAPQTFHLLVRGSSQGGISPAVDNRRVNSNSPMENAPTSFTPVQVR